MLFWFLEMCFPLQCSVTIVKNTFLMCFHSISFAVQNIPSSWVEFKCEQDCHYCDKSSIFTVFYGCLSLSFCSSHALFLFPFTPPHPHPPFSLSFTASPSVSLFLPLSDGNDNHLQPSCPLTSGDGLRNRDSSTQTRACAHTHCPNASKNVSPERKGDKERGMGWGRGEEGESRVELRDMADV